MPRENPQATCKDVLLDHDYVYETTIIYFDVDHNKKYAEIYRCLICNVGRVQFTPNEAVVPEGSSSNA